MKLLLAVLLVAVYMLACYRYASPVQSSPPAMVTIAEPGWDAA